MNILRYIFIGTTLHRFLLGIHVGKEFLGHWE